MQVITTQCYSSAFGSCLTLSPPAFKEINNLPATANILQKCHGPQNTLLYEYLNNRNKEESFYLKKKKNLNETNKHVGMFNKK